MQKEKKNGEKFIAFSIEFPFSIVIDYGTMRWQEVKGLFILRNDLNSRHNTVKLTELFTEHEFVVGKDVMPDKMKGDINRGQLNEPWLP